MKLQKITTKTNVLDCLIVLGCFRFFGLILRWCVRPSMLIFYKQISHDLTKSKFLLSCFGISLSAFLVRGHVGH